MRNTTQRIQKLQGPSRVVMGITECIRVWKVKGIIPISCIVLIVSLSFYTAKDDEQWPKGLGFLSAAIGWGYFFAWSLSFYPQVGLL